MLWRLKDENLIKGKKIDIKDNFDFDNKSILSNIKLLELKTKSIDNKINIQYAKSLALSFLYNLEETIISKIKLKNRINKNFDTNERDDIKEELELINKDITILSNDNEINSLEFFNLINSYSAEYIEELISLNKEIKELSLIDCDECGSTMEYLENTDSFHCGNEDCSFETFER